MSSTTNHYCPDPEKCRIHSTPTPIDPADIRPGDVVDVVEVDRITVREVLKFYMVDEEGSHWERDNVDGRTLHLVHRPDPDAEVIEAIAKAVQDEFYSAKWESLHESTREMARQQARLALTIVRERDAKRAET